MNGSRMRYSYIVKAFLLSLLIMIPSCHAKLTTKITKVIFISIDALRPDFLGCYNPEIRTTPNIDRFASQNIVCTNVVAQAASTVISHKSILYSLYPSIHKTSKQSVPHEKIQSPIQVLKSEGFKTAAMVGGGQLSQKFGFSKGFDEYLEPLKKPTDKEPITDLAKRAFLWLQNNHKEKFFLFLHTYEVHCPYKPREDYAKQFTGWYKGEIDPKDKCGDTFYNKTKITAEDYKFIRDLYAAKVKEVDDFIGSLLEELKSLGIYDETLIVFFSDHGESLGERKYIGHNQLYDVQVRIPLIFHIPGAKPSRLNALLEAIDIMPTIFDQLGIRNDFPFQGRSILPFLEEGPEKTQERVRISEQVDRVAVRKGNWALIFSPSGKHPQELYYRPQDPEETSNLSLEYGMIAHELKLHYVELLQKNKDLAAQFVVTESSKPKLNEEERERLKALGYVD